MSDPAILARGHLPDLRCPDCGARGRPLRHTDACATTRTLDELYAGDGDWLAARPNAPFRRRRLQPVEITWLRAHGAVVLPGASVIVTPIADGVRHRRFLGVIL